MTKENALLKRRSWSGDMSSLVEEVAAVQSELGYSADRSLTNVRAVRHYQNIGCVGKARELKGAKGVYDYRHLIEAVSVRVLLGDGWKLAMISDILSRIEDVEIERLILDRCVGSAPVPEAAVRESVAPVPPPSSAALAALEMISGFRKTAGMVPPPPPVASLASSSPRAPQAPRKLSEYSPASWLHITVDELALAKAEDGTVTRALAEAAAVLASLKT